MKDEVGEEIFQDDNTNSTSDTTIEQAKLQDTKADTTSVEIKPTTDTTTTDNTNDNSTKE